MPDDVAADWFPDPRGRHHYRYFDGREWTDHVADDGRVGRDPLHEPTPAEPDPREVTRAALAARALDVAFVLDVVLPGTGHLLRGRGRTPLTAGLIAATIAAVAVSHASLGLFGAGVALWAAAAVVAVRDLRRVGSHAPVTTQAGLALPVVAGALLAAAPLLPFYRVSAGPSSALVSGVRAFGVIDVVLFAVGAAIAVTGAAAAGLGPLPRRDPPMALRMALAVGAVLALGLVAFRALVDPVPGGDAVTVGRSVGLWLALWSSLALVLAGLDVLRAATVRR